jgi:hypothetical protein
MFRVTPPPAAGAFFVARALLPKETFFLLTGRTGSTERYCICRPTTAYPRRSIVAPGSFRVLPYRMGPTLASKPIDLCSTIWPI